MTMFRTLTVVARVRKDCEDAVRQVMEAYGETIQDRNSSIGFVRSETLHFARWVLADPPRGHPERPTQLVFCGSFDDIPQDEQIREVVRLAAVAFDEIYQFCESYPDGPNRTDADRERFLREHAIEANAIFVGAPDRTLKQIRDEARLRDGIERFLNSRDFTGHSALEVVAAIRQFVAADPALQWGITPPPPRRRTLPSMILFAALALFALPWVALWLIILRVRYESTDRPDNLMPSRIDPILLRKLERLEDRLTQNQFSQLMEVKPGRYRRFTMKLVLRVTDFLSRNYFTKGEISHIPSIHFASWTLIDGDTRLLFQSNFDGSWDSYLGDFIDKAAFGLNAFLSNCTGFPRTQFLFFKGVNDVEHYKAWARNANVPTQLWYTAYPELNVKNVNTNSKIRLGLLQPMNEAQATEWLRNL